MTSTRDILTNALYFGFQYPHHGAHSGFSGLAHEMAQICKVHEFAHPDKYTSILGKVRLRKAAHWFVPKWFEWNERRALNRVKNGGLIHYFFPEDSLRQGAKHKPSVKTALTCHQPISHMKRLKESGYNPGFFDGLQSADLVLLMSDGELQAYRDFLPNADVQCIRHGIDTQFFRPRGDERKPGPFRILTVGSWLRDYRTWAETANDLTAAGADVEFVVIANRSSQNEACEYVHPSVKVSWLTGISDQMLAESYRRADVLFLPLKDAWANNALLEAMASGLPVVCTNLPATREYLGPDGIYVSSNAEMCATALFELLHDARKRGLVSSALRNRACKEFSWPQIAKQHIEAYKTILSR